MTVWSNQTDSSLILHFVSNSQIGHWVIILQILSTLEIFHNAVGLVPGVRFRLYAIHSVLCCLVHLSV